MANRCTMVLGVGSFAHSTAALLGEHGRVATYLTRDYGHYPPSLVSEVFTREVNPSPVPLVRQLGVDVIVPQSIDWALQPWAADLQATGAGIFCPTGEGLRLERERDFARQLCERFGVPFPRSFVAANRGEAERLLRDHPIPFVIKNPWCRPLSPIHTIVCRSPAETAAWLSHLNYAEGAFLQENVGTREAGHIAFVSAGEIHSMVTNQEYKRAFDHNTGIIAGAPLGGLVERDEHDRYGLARTLLHPLAPWFREVNYHGPVQVTAAMHQGRWVVLEYNVRIGVTSGAMLLRMLQNPLEVVRSVCRNQWIEPRWKAGLPCGCSVTHAAYGYPFTQITPPAMPVTVQGEPTGLLTDVWWNEVEPRQGILHAIGHRVADVIGLGPDMSSAIRTAYAAVERINVPGGYHRTDIGQTLWPPGHD